MGNNQEHMYLHLLEGIPLFSGLTGDEKWDLARRITVREIPRGEHVFWIGEKGVDFYVIVSGRVLITYPDGDGKEITLAVLETGDFFGEISLLDGGPRTASARAASDCSLLRLDRDQFFKFIADYPSAAAHIMTALGRRQRETVDKLRGIRNLNEVMDQKLTTWEKAAHTIASLAASPYFLLAHAIGFGTWIIGNLALRSHAPDPFPFMFLCFWTSCEAIFLSMFIMISQNVQGQKDRLRTELEYQVALKAQFEIMQLHRKLDELSERDNAAIERSRDDELESDPIA